MKRFFVLIAALAIVATACSSKSPTADQSPSPSTESASNVSATEKDFAIGVASPTATHGDIVFSITNSGPSVHEFVIFKSDLAEDKLPLKSDGTAVDEAGAGVTHITEKESIGSGKTETLDVTLVAGSYVLICNLAGHYKAGMHAALTVV